MIKLVLSSDIKSLCVIWFTSLYIFILVTQLEPTTHLRPVDLRPVLQGH